MRNRVKDKLFIGFVEDNNDPEHLGRCKIRVHTVFDNIPKEDIPWASPFKDLNGNEFSAPDIGKVVTVVFNNDNIYKPEFIYAEHYNINLENKLKGLSKDDYTSFKAIQFDHSTQIYRSKSEGLKLDHEYSNVNITDDGNININLRDNKSKSNIGSPDASQAAILGTSYMDYMDKFMDWLNNFIRIMSLGNAEASPNIGPYLGNLGLPMVINPAFAESVASFQATIYPEYIASRDPKFLSKHIWIVDNNQVKEQNREYIDQQGDEWKSTTSENHLSKRSSSAYTPEARPETGRPEYKNSAIPNDIMSGTIESEANIQTINVSNYKNGEIPISEMKLNKWLSKDLGGDAAYLMAEASDSLDQMMVAFNASNFSGKQKLIFTDGYRSYKRQVAIYADKGPGLAARPGTSNHGWGIAVDMYWGVRTKMTKEPNKRQSGFKHPMYKWFLENANRYGWYNPTKLRDDSGTDEWWHWEYHGKRGPAQVIASRYNGAFTSEDISNIRNSGGTYV